MNVGSRVDFADNAESRVDAAVDEDNDGLEYPARLMQAFLSTLTAALLFIHTAFGCCWHHAHCSTIAVADTAPCCHHHQHDTDSKQSEKPSKCNVECTGACTYVAPQKVKVEAPNGTATNFLAVLSSLPGRGIEALSFWETVSPLSDWAPPLRAHLLHQVLLN